MGVYGDFLRNGKNKTKILNAVSDKKLEWVIKFRFLTSKLGFDH